MLSSILRKFGYVHYADMPGYAQDNGFALLKEEDYKKLLANQKRTRKPRAKKPVTEEKIDG